MDDLRQEFGPQPNGLISGDQSRAKQTVEAAPFQKEGARTNNEAAFVTHGPKREPSSRPQMSLSPLRSRHPRGYAFL